MIAEKASSIATYGGAGTALASGASDFLGLTPSEWSAIGVIGGLLIGAVGLVIKTYFEWLRLKAERKP